MAVVTWDGSSSTDFATAANWNTGSVPTSSDDVIIPNTSSINDCVLDGDRTINSLEVQGNGSFSMNDHDLTIAGENSSSRALDIGNSTVTFVGGTGTLIFTLGSGSTDLTGISHLSGSTELRNLQFNGGATFNLTGDTTVTGNLTISAGTLDTTGSNHALTVTGTTEVSGTLTCNASTVSLGSGYTGDYALLGSGTVNFGTGTNTVGAVNTHSVSGITKTSGTITFDTQKTGSQSIGPTVTSHNTHFNFGTSTVNFDLSGGAGTTFAIEQHSGSSKTLTITATTVNFKSNSYIYQNNTDTNIFKVIGDLVIDASKTLETYYDNADDFGSKVEVTGNVTLNGTLNAYSASNPKPMDFGSLTINDGGTYNATSGTTTITDEGDGSGGTNGYAWYNVTGTYTHNNGTVKFTGNSDTDIREDAFYNLIINGDTSSVDFYIRQKDGSSSSSGHIKIFNNLDIQRGGFQRAKSANELSVFGIIDICSGGTGGYFGDTSDTGIYNLGAVNIHNNGTLNLSNGDNNINSIRNIAGTVAQD
jgi:hypothetical protein